MAVIIDADERTITLETGYKWEESINAFMKMIREKNK